jgi:protein-tyrosine phosphatase
MSEPMRSGTVWQMNRNGMLAAGGATGMGVLLEPSLAGPAFANNETAVDPLSRFIFIQGAFNTRDIGGYQADGGQLARGRFYRSSSLNRITPIGVNQLATLNLKYAADFRTQAELARGADMLPEGVRSLLVPVGDPGPGVPAGAAGPPPPGGFAEPQPETVEEFRSYVLLEQGRQSLGVALRTLAEPDALPFLWHCNSGTYRTGWATAVLMTAIGVDRADVYADFLVSNIAFGGTYAFVEYLDVAFEQADKLYGSFAGYVRDGLGIGDELLERIRQSLVRHAD